MSGARTSKRRDEPRAFTLNCLPPPSVDWPSTGICAVTKRSGLPEFRLSLVKSTRGFALNLINAGVLGIGIKPRYCGSSVRSFGRGAASCWSLNVSRHSISLAWLVICVTDSEYANVYGELVIVQFQASSDKFVAADAVAAEVSACSF